MAKLAPGSAVLPPRAALNGLTQRLPVLRGHVNWPVAMVKLAPRPAALPRRSALLTQRLRPVLRGLVVLEQRCQVLDHIGHHVYLHAMLLLKLLLKLSTRLLQVCHISTSLLLLVLQGLHVEISSATGSPGSKDCKQDWHKGIIAKLWSNNKQCTALRQKLLRTGGAGCDAGKCTAHARKCTAHTVLSK